MSTGLESNLCYKSFLGSPGYTGHLSTFFDLYIFDLSYFIRGHPRGEANRIGFLGLPNCLGQDVGINSFVRTLKIEWNDPSAGVQTWSC